MKQSILEEFWVDDPEHFGGYFARGTDRDENGKLYPLKIRTSDMGHLLLSDVLEQDDPKVVSIIKNLFSPDMLAENGIRTLSRDSVRYHPEAYHNGSVWPWDTYTIALGLEKHGYYALAKELEDRILRFYERTNSLAEYGSGADENSNNITRQITIFDPDLNRERIDQYSMYNIIQPPRKFKRGRLRQCLL